MATAKGAAGLGKFEGDDILAVGVGVSDAGKVLAKALDLTPQTWKRGDRVFCVMECRVDHLSHPPIKNTDGVERKHNLVAEVGLIVDADFAGEMMAEQREQLKIAAEKAQGIERIDFAGEDDDE